MRHLVLLCIVCTSLHGRSYAGTVTWNLRTKFGGVTEAGIAAAINEAKIHFAGHPGDTIVIKFDAGTYPLIASSESSKGIIDLSGVKPGPDGRLIFSGAGMDNTTLVFDPAKAEIYGRGVYRVSFIGFHMTRKDCTVSQGHVIEVKPGHIDMEVENGFPTPQDIFNPNGDSGRYLRRFTDNPTDPQLIVANNNQVRWKSAEHISGNRWRINLNWPGQIVNYKPGDLVAIKSKHGGQAYWLSSGSDFIFEDIKWTQEARGVFRGGFNKIRITHCVIERAPAIEGQTPCLSTPGGGPQIGQPADLPTSDNVVEDCEITATGDDSIAFFNSSGTIRNCSIRDSFARGILLYNSPLVNLDGNTFSRSLPLRANNIPAPSTHTSNGTDVPSNERN